MANSKYSYHPLAICHKLYSRTNHGFTLIELLIVVSIIGILIAIVSSSFLTAQKQARDSKRKGDLEQIRQALETYRSENGQYPATSSYSTDLEPDYITNLPSDPSAGYDYAYTGNTTTYTLCAALEITPSSPDTCTATCGTKTCNYLTESP